MPKLNNDTDYAATRQQAIAKLRVAITFTEDGGLLDAASCAVDAIALLFKATRQRNEVLTEAAGRFKGVRAPHA